MTDPVKLWTGVTANSDSNLSGEGVLRGSFKHRERRGRCAIYTSTPSLWLFAAGALGFDIASLWGGDDCFHQEARVYLSSNVPIQAPLWREGVDVVFSDSEVVCNRPSGPRMYERQRKYVGPGAALALMGKSKHF